MASRLEWSTYNAIDSATTIKIWNEIENDLARDSFTPAYDQTMSIIEPIIFMMSRGIAVDVDALARTRVSVENEIARLQADLDKICGFSLNVSSPRQCRQYFYGVLGFPVYTSRTTGQPTTDDKALARLARKGCREASLVNEIRSLSKLHGTYLSIGLDADNRLRCFFNPRGTKYGRLSSSKTIYKTGMNMQNLHPQFKEFLVADPGYMFIELDKRQAEWVATAYISGDAHMIEVCESGVDPHAYTGGMISKAPFPFIMKEHKAIGHHTDPFEIERIRRDTFTPEEMENIFLPRIFSIRQAGKKSNHGLNYDMRYRRFALENEIDEREAQRIYNIYHATYPGLRAWYETVRHKLAKDRTLENCFGRRMCFFEAWGEDLFKAAYSSLPQSTVVDMLNRGMSTIYYHDSPELRAFELQAQVHDNIFGQYPISDFTKMARAILHIRRELEPTMEYGGRRFTIATDLKVGVNWGQRGGKNPGGMGELAITDDVDELASRLEKAYDDTQAR